MAEHGDVKLTELLATLADCPKARAAGIYGRCKAVYEGLTARYPRARQKAPAL
jgi:hypothetical protein